MTDDEIAAQKMMQPARDAMAREELRDKFEMAALTGMSTQFNDIDWGKPWHRNTIRELAFESYAIADAMLEARKAKP